MIKPIYKTIDNSPNDDRFRKHDERSQTKDTNTAKPNGNISLVHSTGMKIFKLDTAVRMTRQLFNLQKNLESEVKSSPFKAAIAFKGERRAKKLYSFIIQNNNNNLPFTKLNSYFSVYNSCFE